MFPLRGEESARDDAAETLDDMAAELEDAILLLGEVRIGGGDWIQELEGTLESFDALAGDLERVSEALPGVSDLAERLRRVTRMAAENLR